jgi:ATP synthase subunit 6
MTVLEEFTCIKLTFIPGLSNSSLTLGLTLVAGLGLTRLTFKFPWTLWTSFTLLLINEVSKMSQNVNKSYMFFILSLFLFLVLTNVLGLVPFVYSPTSQLIVALGTSFSVWFSVVILGFRQQGLNFLANFIPASTPMILAWLMVPIEVISYTARGISLGLRLCINVTTGHLLQIIVSDFARSLYKHSNPILSLSSCVPLLLLVCLFYLEFGIMLMQAYVFTTLTIIYIAESQHTH